MRAMLGTCAGLMAQNSDNPELNFFPLRTELGRSRAACIDYLADEVEHLTSGQRTVREIPHDAIADSPMGINNLYVTVCDASTAPGRVTSLTAGMTPYIISPGKGLGCVKAQPR